VTPTRVVADHQWAGRWRTAADVLATAGPAGSEVVRVAGTLVPGLRDHHVHLGLVDRGALAGSALTAVDDLGWSLDEALAWRRERPGGCAVRVAGPFLTAPGGYPTSRPWAPAEAVAAVGSIDDAVATVTRLAGAGVDLIKVALHAGMPLLDDARLRAVVDTAHRARLPVVVHAEGPGQAARAQDAGADVLAHTPWTEALAEDLITAMARRMSWISTLRIHPRGDRSSAVATGNLRRFARAGGRIRYGTDLGNGPSPVGVSVVELQALADAGLAGEAIVAAIADADRAGPLTWSPLPPPASTAEVPGWLSGLRRRTIADLAGS
jgi:imidazolonepropionase-like amidohydrolase